MTNKTIKTWPYFLTTPEPTFMPLMTARELVVAGHLLPRPVLAAIEATLEHASRRVLLELANFPGKRGNPARRMDAEDDQRAADLLRDQYCSVPACGASCDCSVDDLPPLGTDGWHFVAMASSDWTGSASDLLATAAAVSVGERPLDMKAWLAWDCWGQWLQRARYDGKCASRASEEAERHVREANRLQSESDRLERLARRHRDDAATLEADVERLNMVGGQYQQVLRLDGPSLLALTRAVDAGHTLEQALGSAPPVG